MEVRAVAKFIRVQPRKVRIVADEVRGSLAQKTVDTLRFHPSKGAFYLRKVIASAVANAVENEGADPRQLKIVRIQVDEGPVLKRITQRSMGRGNRINKKMSHITVVVDAAEESDLAPRKEGKAKPRPTLAPKKARGKKAAAVPAPVAEEVKEEAPAVAEETVEATQPAVEAQKEAKEENN